MTYVMLILRLLHIVSGAFWVGTVITAVFFIEPTAQALDREGERFLAHLVIRRRLALVLAIAATVTVTAGALLYWIDSGGLRLEWITTGTGIAFTAGGLSALIALAIAGIFLKPAVDRLATITDRDMRADDAPAPSRIEDEAFERRIRRWSLIQVTLLVFAVSAMAVARYLP